MSDLKNYTVEIVRESHIRLRVVEKFYLKGQATNSAEAQAKAADKLANFPPNEEYRKIENSIETAETKILDKRVLSVSATLTPL